MKSKYFSLSISLIGVSIFCTIPVLTSCGSTGIVVANYESYMSPIVIDNNRSIDGKKVNYTYYATNEDIQAKFADSYDVAVPSTYTVLELVKEGLVAKLDWTKFHVHSLYHEGDDQTQPGYDMPNAEDIAYAGYDYATPKSFDDIWNDPKNALSLWSYTTAQIIYSVDEYAHDNNYLANDESLLNYSIPYFLQDLMFAYHGDYIDELPSPTQRTDGQYGDNKWYSRHSDGSTLTWNEVTGIISPKNQDQDPRFLPNSRQHMSMVDDSRTIYDMCHLINTGNQSMNPPPVDQSIQNIDDVYGSFTNKFVPGTFYLNSDSQQVLYTFATPMKQNEGQANGIISYNGDVAFAIMGGGNDDWTDTWHCSPEGSDDELKVGNVHIIKMLHTPISLDMMVINKKDQNNQAVYDLVRNYVLDGCDASPDVSHQSGDIRWIGSGVDQEDGKEQYQTITNFEWSYYTPTLYNIEKFVARNEENPDTTNSYYDIMYPDDEDKAELLAEVNDINYSNGDDLIEMPLTPLTKSNMTIEWMKYKERI